MENQSKFLVLESLVRERLVESTRIAELLWTKAQRLGRSSRISLLRMRFRVLAKIQDMEERLYQFQATPRDQRDALREELTLAARLLGDIIEEAQAAHLWG